MARTSRKRLTRAWRYHGTAIGLHGSACMARPFAMALPWGCNKGPCDAMITAWHTPCSTLRATFVGGRRCTVMAQWPWMPMAQTAMLCPWHGRSYDIYMQSSGSFMGHVRANAIPRFKQHGMTVGVTKPHGNAMNGHGAAMALTCKPIFIIF